MHAFIVVFGTHKAWLRFANIGPCLVVTGLCSVDAGLCLIHTQGFVGHTHGTMVNTYRDVFGACSVVFASDRPVCRMHRAMLGIDKPMS